MTSMTKIMMAGVLAVGTLTAGCQTTPAVTAQTTQAITSNALQAYNWQLVHAKGTNNVKVPQLFFDPNNLLILDFISENDNHFVVLLNTCNNMAAAYSIMSGNVQVGNIRSTRMACPEPQASFDKAAVDTVKGKYSISKNTNNSPILTITNANQVAIVNLR